MATSPVMSRSSSNFKNGLVLNGKPLVQAYSGRVIWVDSAGGGGSRGTFDAPVTTLSAALDLVTSGNGDIIFLKEGHAESISAALSSSKSLFAIIGLGYGSSRPSFTNAIGSTADAFSFSGDNVAVQNIKWKEATVASSVVTVFNVSGDHFILEGCYIELGTSTLRVLTHDTTAKKGLTVIGNEFVGVTSGPDVVVRLEKTHQWMKYCNNFSDFKYAAGIDTGVVVLVSGTTKSGGHLLKDNISMGHADGGSGVDVFVLQSATPSDGGLVIGNFISGADATDNLGTTPASGLGFINNMVTEPGKGVPAEADYAGARPIATTPAS